ncbi:hypothetical protein QJS04_geneDACA001050 [Acorus gramineus]|uniref:Uncharacterized protein n=1 Tax=Acorus gramineus TaxID=55184 RepID=A0AAV9ABH1_ACOGR|nr:hypothetical protein QJS04_geneDACA001050 [Acorus gramineus]
MAASSVPKFTLTPTKPIPTLLRRRSHLPCKAISTTSTSTTSDSYWSSTTADIESHLDLTLPLRHPLLVHHPMRHLSLHSPPRTLAPALCVAACELVCGAPRERALDAACALHLMHAASNAHERLPTIALPRDDDDEGGVVRHAFGPNIELLTPDGILPLGYEMVARSAAAAEDPKRTLRVVLEMARAMGSEGYASAQYAEFHAEGSERFVAERKYGGLYACGAACGAVMGGAEEEVVERLRRFGLYVGMLRHHGGLFLEGDEDLKSLALMELEMFESDKVEILSSLVYV